MATSTVEERVSQVSNDDIPIAAQDTRRPYEKKIGVHLILASILFQYIAFLSISINLSNNLTFNEALKWTKTHSSSTAAIFAGK